MCSVWISKESHFPFSLSFFDLNYLPIKNDKPKDVPPYPNRRKVVGNKQSNHELAGESMLCISGHVRSIPEASVHPAVRTVTRRLPCHMVVRLIPLFRSCHAYCQPAFNTNSFRSPSVLCQPCSLVVALHASSWNISMRWFKIYGEWSVQKAQTDIYTHMRNAVTLVWGLLRLAPIMIT